ncbi:hypothetical protein CPB83DRAFT_830523 [Crepidotus variabilis]|uniref:Uncharacterized protein n=1 Tax=Crepidotus variabilis TaxID=179855 RepID=A0A9P6JWT1_9AGAR|nr:hypothetical protein CPB83DRAFT_830523 [Crepidotus variabilis]
MQPYRFATPNRGQYFATLAMASSGDGFHLIDVRDGDAFTHGIDALSQAGKKIKTLGKTRHQKLSSVKDRALGGAAKAEQNCWMTLDDWLSTDEPGPPVRGIERGTGCSELMTFCRAVIQPSMHSPSDQTGVGVPCKREDVKLWLKSFGRRQKRIFEAGKLSPSSTKSLSPTNDKKNPSKKTRRKRACKTPQVPQDMKSAECTADLNRNQKKWEDFRGQHASVMRQHTKLISGFCNSIDT